MTDTILLRYSPALGLVDAEGKPIGVVCVPKVLSGDTLRAVVQDVHGPAVYKCVSDAGIGL